MVADSVTVVVLRPEGHHALADWEGWEEEVWLELDEGVVVGEIVVRVVELAVEGVEVVRDDVVVVELVVEIVVAVEDDAPGVAGQEATALEEPY